MKILAIGNSFSQDATRYLEKVAAAEGQELEVVSLYIGGCSLERHFRNLKSDAKAYEIIYNGQNTGFYTSIKEALVSRAWDVVTLQQQSLQSADFETFEPYLSIVADAVRELCPKSKIYMHETWAYENESKKLGTTKYTSHDQMYKDIEKSYIKAAKTINADGIIPCGKLFNRLHTVEGFPVHRDGFHASITFGRYALALMWYKTLFNKDIENIGLIPLDGILTNPDIYILEKLFDEM